MIAYGRSTVTAGEDAFCAFAGLRDTKSYAMTHEEILAKYGEAIRMVDRLPETLADAMGNRMYLAVFDTEEKMQAFYRDVLVEAKQPQTRVRPSRIPKKRPLPA